MKQFRTAIVFHRFLMLPIRSLCRFNSVNVFFFFFNISRNKFFFFYLRRLVKWNGCRSFVDRIIRCQSIPENMSNATFSNILKRSIFNGYYCDLQTTVESWTSHEVPTPFFFYSRNIAVTLYTSFVMPIRKRKTLRSTFNWI